MEGKEPAYEKVHFSSLEAEDNGKLNKNELDAVSSLRED